MVTMSEEPRPKKRRGRPPMSPPPADQLPQQPSCVYVTPSSDPPRRRGRPRIHPPVQGEERRPRGRPPLGAPPAPAASSGLVAIQPLLDQLNQRPDEPLDSYQVRVWAEAAARQVAWLNGRVGDMQLQLAGKDEEIFLLKFRLLEAGVNPDITMATTASLATPPSPLATTSAPSAALGFAAAEVSHSNGAESSSGEATPPNFVYVDPALAGEARRLSAPQDHVTVVQPEAPEA